MRRTYPRSDFTDLLSCMGKISCGVHVNFFSFYETLANKQSAHRAP